MKVIVYPLRYLSLRAESGRRLWTRDGFLIVLVTAISSLPFVFSQGNYFGDGGFLSRIGSFVSVLAGFYIAALVGIASLSSAIGDLDDEISNGAILLHCNGDAEPDRLTRRQYVCSLFGFLASVALFISLASIVLVFLSQFEESYRDWLSYLGTSTEYTSIILKSCRGILIISMSFIVSHMFITTFHGLYYYMERIYYKSPVMGTKNIFENTDEQADGHER